LVYKAKYANQLGNLGINSLIVVEMCSWFLKKLNVDVPVLKIIGGVFIPDISRDVLDKLSLTFDTSKSPSETPNDKLVSVSMVEQGKSPFVGVVEIIDSEGEIISQGEE
jgi:hypothetical protein